MDADDKDNQYSERPPDSDFQQQNLKAWQPLLTPGWVIGTFAVIGVIFMPIGLIVLDASNSVVQVEQQYDNLNCSTTPPGIPPVSTGCYKEVTLNIPEAMGVGGDKVFFYYKLTNFYQNHRRYVKSRSDSQLRGDANPTLSTCTPLETWNGTTMYPCGLIANSYFNDTFNNPTVTDPSGTSEPVNWTDKGIAWDSDVKDKFKLPATPYPDTTSIGPGGYQLPKVTDEDFIVWMRTAGLPTFKKLRYIINGTMPKGSTFKTYVHDVFPVNDFDGKKFVVLSTASWLGGQNFFLAYAYISVASICLFLALAFLIKHLVAPRSLGDMRYFNWDGK